MVLKPSQLQSVEDTQTVELDYSRSWLREVQEWWREIQAVIQDQVVRGPQSSIAEEVVKLSLRVKLGVTPVAMRPA